MGTDHVDVTLHLTEVEVILAALHHYELHHADVLPQTIAEKIRTLRKKLDDATAY